MSMYALMFSFWLATGGAIAAQSVDPDEERAVRKVIESFIAARSAKDVEALTQLYTEDGQFTTALTEPVRGRAALQKLWAADFSASNLGVIAPRTIKTIQFIKPDTAVVTTVGEMGPFPQGENRRISDVFVLTRNGQRWQIASQHLAHLFPRLAPK